jgi:hypothetical protein
VWGKVVWHTRINVQGRPVDFITVERAADNAERTNEREEQTTEERVFMLNTVKDGGFKHWTDMPMENTVDVEHGNQTVRLSFEVKKERMEDTLNVRSIEKETGRK